MQCYRRFDELDREQQSLTRGTVKTSLASPCRRLPSLLSFADPTYDHSSILDRDGSVFTDLLLLYGYSDLENLELIVKSAQMLF